MKERKKKNLAFYKIMDKKYEQQKMYAQRIQSYRYHVLAFNIEMDASRNPRKVYKA